MTPEYFIKNSTMIQELDKYDKINSITIDEAHCIVDYGNDIRPAYKQLVIIKELCKCPIVALTATATSYILREIKKMMRDNVEVINCDIDRNNLNI